jgi:hypothetical protein
VRIVITVRVSETKEPLVKDSKITVSKDEGPDYSKFAFVLKKSVFERYFYSGSVKSSSEIDITNPHL